MTYFEIIVSIVLLWLSLEVVYLHTRIHRLADFFAPPIVPLPPVSVKRKRPKKRTKRWR